jgi:aspartyl-tRNA synthetase
MQVSFVEFILFRLYSRPHDSQSDGIETIRFELINVFFHKRHVLIVSVGLGEVRWDFDGDVHAVEIKFTMLIVVDFSMFDFDTAKGTTP